MSKSIDFTDLLVKRLKSRDTSALDYLYEHYHEALYGVIQRTVNHQEIAEETLHDVFLKIWNQIDQYDPKKGTLFTWMYRIARNRAVDSTRSRDFKTSEKSDDINDFVDMFESDVQTDDFGLRELIVSLGEQCKKLIQLNFFMGYSHTEISKNEDIPLGSVKTKIRSCLKSILQKLKGEFE